MKTDVFFFISVLISMVVLGAKYVLFGITYSEYGIKMLCNAEVELLFPFVQTSV